MAKLYFPHEIDNMDDKAVRKAYSALRKIANKRLKNLDKNDLGGYGAFRYSKLEQMHPDEVAQELAEVSRFLRDPRHTVRGAKSFRSNVIDALHDKPGFEDINEKNFQQWADYMDYLREKYGNKLFDSGDATDVFMEAERLNIPKWVMQSQYELFRNNLDVIQNISSITNEKHPGRAISNADFIRAVEQAKRK